MPPVGTSSIMSLLLGTFMSAIRCKGVRDVYCITHFMCGFSSLWRHSPSLWSNLGVWVWFLVVALSIIMVQPWRDESTLEDALGFTLPGLRARIKPPRNSGVAL
jgi:hypothetical protein